MAKTIFEHLAGIKEKKVSWDTLTDADKKTFSPFLINRFLSMNLNYIEFVNDLQKYSIGLLKPREVYKIYYYFLPAQKTWDKYIKGKTEKKYEPELLDYLTKWFGVSKREVVDYLQILPKEEVREILSAYGLDKKRITKLTRFKNS
jgi:hypothetical protein|tara:strand:+ start:99 stop:536 length:438 start_codon:yes stop_codon:yes gene_type:complete